MSTYKLATQENGQAINHMLIVQHLDSGDYDYSEFGTVEDAVQAAYDEVPEKYEGLREEIEASMEWYWPNEALEAAENGAGWPVALGFVEEEAEDADFIETADSRETSIELMEAILKVADGDEGRAEAIWKDGPNSAELAAIIEIVTKNGQHETTEFCWGAAGTNWANELAAH